MLVGISGGVYPYSLFVDIDDPLLFNDIDAPLDEEGRLKLLDEDDAPLFDDIDAPLDEEGRLKLLDEDDAPLFDEYKFKLVGLFFFSSI